MRNIWLPLLAASCLVMAQSATEKSQTVLSDAQKKEVISLIKKVISNQPELMIESLQNFQTKQQAAAENKAVMLAKTHAQALFSNATDPFVGKADATTVVVEFLDYQCGYCKRMHKVLNDYLESHPGKIKIIYKVIPMLGDRSKQAALLALGALQQGEFKDVHQAMMDKSRLSDEDIQSMGKKYQLSQEQKHMGELQMIQNMNLAEKLDIEATPTVYILKPDQSIEIIRGYVSAEQFKKHLGD
ncbi:thioredoxin domain-containing protein [Gammaproteobacteria bacterium]|nr:thioredoxin domain-containing protein [Gammaproteobacteria bacterium]